jgi:hypothetical protein
MEAQFGNLEWAHLPGTLTDSCKVGSGSGAYLPLWDLCVEKIQGHFY